MSEEEYKQVIDIIVKNMHIEYVGVNRSVKSILDSNNLLNVNKELKEMITNEK